MFVFFNKLGICHMPRKMLFATKPLAPSRDLVDLQISIS